ncbi:hypothetical protein JF50_10490 [Pseudoalteromonas luteoviolacea]|uniref:DUF676 domain-containing protein n=1 Tax=Pseudoalteromonas luteoviolacea TaxID=43657 RepID=A0A0C1QAF6_9GAMM|nr:alpha/beta hydrolase [Pseudoalteromonas luteoviolacea]KID57596.1 hypothetical protein JF50_10490 [Pseudoalteromonas luteoviolacea]
MFKLYLKNVAPILAFVTFNGIASVGGLSSPEVSSEDCQITSQQSAAHTSTANEGNKSGYTDCRDLNVSPSQSRFASGYTVRPNRSISTQVVRYRYVCIRWRWDDQQPVGVTDPILYDDGLELNAGSIAPHERRYRVCEEAVLRPFDETGGYLSIRYGNDNRLNKPIVLVQGYNFNMQGFTSNQVPNEQETLDNFARYSGLYDNRFTNAFAHGYDLVVFRFANQDDGIRHNAKALASALKSLSAQSQEIRLLGHSMGGVAGRLALSYLEQEGFNHKVKRFVAIDSPFRGVHVPADVINFAYEIENQANKMKCGARYPTSGSKRRQCREERDRLRSIKDIFTTTTFRDLHEGSSANLNLRNHIRSLDNYFTNMSGTYTTAISYGDRNGHPIPEVYTGNRALDLKLDIQWHLSGGRHSRLYSTPRSDDNGSYIQLYYDISREMDKASSWVIGYDRGIPPSEWQSGRTSFVTTTSAFDGHVFDQTKYYASSHSNHKQILFKISDLGL